MIKVHLKDQFEQKWASEIESNSKCVLYKTFKTTFKFENYLLLLHGYHRKLLIRFRLCNHKLAVERGRYNNMVQIIL